MPCAAAALGDCVTAIGYTALTANLVSNFTYTNYVTATRKCVASINAFWIEVEPLYSA